MKVSLNTIRHLNSTYNCGVDPYSYGIDEIVRRIGLQLGAVESVENVGELYDGIVVVKVVSAQKHPDADKLQVCMIDDGGVTPDVERGSGGLIQVVCGAPNAQAGLLAAWIPPGVTVPSTVNKDPFVLEAREIRGKVSNGMLASPRELGMGDEHNGILEIKPEDVGKELATAGTLFRKLYGLDDVVIDCENKMFIHRPDCFGMLGIARELSGIFGDQYTSPAWYLSAIEHEVETSLPFSVQNDIPNLVARFTAQALGDVAVKQSPLWLQSFLARLGMKSINNVVDYTNFFMLETAQPLHAFDYDKLARVAGIETGGEVVLGPRLAREGETLLLLGGKEIMLTTDDMVIAANDVPVALAGVMGGKATEVDETTTNVVIECANFDMYTIRRTSMRHGLFTDAVTRFNKGQSPLQNDKVLAKMVEELVRFAGARTASDVLDVCSFDLSSDNLNRVSTTTDFINDRLGTHLTSADMKRLLENVEFVVAIDGENDENLLITAPFWRMDIAIAEDIVEEVGRLHGYETLPAVLPPRTSKPPKKNTNHVMRQRMRDVLKSAGANEVFSYSFVHGDVLRAVGVNPDESAYHLRNAISPDLQYFRTAVLPSLLTKIHPNIKAQAGDAHNAMVLYEFGKAHVKGDMEELEPQLPRQMHRLALVVAADQKTAKKAYVGSPYYMAKKYLEAALKMPLTYVQLSEASHLSKPFEASHSAEILCEGVSIGVIGEFHTQAKKIFKLPDFAAGFEIDLDRVHPLLKETPYIPLSQYPSTQQDITFEVDSDVSWSQIYDLVHAELAVGSAEDALRYSVEPLDIFQADDSNAKRMSFRIILSHRHKTMTTAEVNNLLEHVAAAACETLKAVRI